ncbi:HAD-IIIC family phosphatase [Streptomyces sp. AF1A]|uniref:HAD-IIIC family phosphatase n=1 Tax=Streptomyces sp. AF1A TaxID=3394350 RepID=UPI0039BC5286
MRRSDAPSAAAPAAGPGTSALDLLRLLRDERRLEAEYDTVAALLARHEVADDPVALRRVGRLLAGADPDRVRAHHPGTPVVTVAVTGSSTVAPVLDPLTAELARHGMPVRPVLGDHGAFVRDLTDSAGGFAGVRYEVALCLLDASIVLRRLPEVWGPDDAARACDGTLALLREVAAGHRARAGGTLVLNTLPLPATWSRRLVDLRSRARLGAVWREFNASLLRLSAEADGVVVIDLDPLLTEGGPLHDARLAHHADAQLGAGLLAAYAREVAHFVRALRGTTRKCLVLDLDHTLWDGVLAEDGPAGVAAAGTPRAEAFGAFQRLAAQLRGQGVLLAVSSRNDPEEVRTVLREHPDMRLREDDFVHIAAGWGPKDEALREIADRVGIGTDALVFADDSPAECARIRAALPEVAVVRLDDEPSLHGERLLRDGWFDQPSLTEEDRERGNRYRAQARGGRLRAGAATVDAYLADLGTGVDFGPPLPYEYARTAQLTQRTNRFNLTGVRLTEAEVAAAAGGADGAELLVARAADRFGEHGLVGAVLTRRAGAVLEVVNVWLSCRVLARGIEHACLADVLARARAAGCREVRAGFTETRKNAPARAFYPELGFTPAESERPRASREPGGSGESRPSGASATGRTRYRHDLRTLPLVPSHIRMTATPAGKNAHGSWLPRRFSATAP